MTSPYAQDAAHYFERNINVLPVMPGHKIPGSYVLQRKTWDRMQRWNDFFSRLINQEEHELFSSWPDAGITLMTGGLSGIIALDFDYDIDGLHSRIQAVTPPSPVKKKGEKGFTAFYRYTEAFPSKQKWKMSNKCVLELLSTGQHTLLPGSIHPNGNPYQWLTPDTLRDFDPSDLPCLPDNYNEVIDGLFGVAPQNIAPSIRALDKSPDYYGETTREDIETALHYIPADEYELWVKIGMGLKASRGDEGFTLWDVWSRKAPEKYKAAEMTAKWNSFKGSGISINSLFYHAMQNGYVPPPKGIMTLPRDNLALPDDPEEMIRKRMEADLYSIMVNPPGLVGKIADWILDTAETPQPLYAIPAAIAAAGAIMSHRIASETNARTNIFTLALGRSGSGKDHPRKCIESLFEASGIPDLISGDPVSGAALHKLLVDAKGASLIQLDEIGRELKAITGKNAASYQASIINNIMKVFSSASSRYRLPARAWAPEGDVKFIDQPCLSIFGTSVAGRFYKAMTSEDAIDGFLSRWLIFEASDELPMDKRGKSIKNPRLT